jgi:hypothetical protein
MKHTHIATGLIAIVATLGLAPALAASTDYFIKFDGVDGESAAPAPVDGWSFGACQSGRCDKLSGSSARRAEPRPTLTISGSNLAAQRAAPVVGDLDGDGAAELAFATQVEEVSSFTLQFDKASPVLAKVCRGKHIAKAELQRGGESLTISDATISCSSGPGGAGTGKPALAGRTVPKQTQGATFGERVNAGINLAAPLTMTFSSGKIHTRTGHVTLMK